MTTVTEATEWLRAQGFDDDFVLREAGLCRREEGDFVDVEAPVMEHVFRFEGPSDPGDEMIVVGVRCEATGRRGVVVSGYGPDTDPENVEFLQRLVDGRHD